MKRIAILVGAIALTGSTFAQKATAESPFSLEGQIGFEASTSQLFVVTVFTEFGLSSRQA